MTWPTIRRQIAVNLKSRTLLMVSHDMGPVRRVADHVMELIGGRLATLR